MSNSFPFQPVDRDVARRWPTLEMLDDVPLPRGQLTITPVTPAEPLVSIAAQSFPIGMSGSAIESDVQSFAVSFLQRSAARPYITDMSPTMTHNDFRFLAAFDQDRAALAPVYTGISTFSFSYDASIPPRGRARGFQVKMPNQKNLSWGKWHELGSRNLHRVIQVSPEVAAAAAKDMLYTGIGDIMQCFSMMPRTRHDTNEGEKFVIDASSMDIGLGPTLYITVHGQFVEGERPSPPVRVLRPIVIRTGNGGWYPVLRPHYDSRPSPARLRVRSSLLTPLDVSYESL